MELIKSVHRRAEKEQLDVPQTHSAVVRLQHARPEHRRGRGRAHPSHCTYAGAAHAIPRTTTQPRRIRLVRFYLVAGTRPGMAGTRPGSAILGAPRGTSRGWRAAGRRFSCDWYLETRKTLGCD